jgi:hypothetical protein
MVVHLNTSLFSKSDFNTEVFVCSVSGDQYNLQLQLSYYRIAVCITVINVFVLWELIHLYLTFIAFS